MASLMKLKFWQYFFLLICSTLFFITPLQFSYAQEFEAKQLKFAYTVNFFKHITWPNEKNKENFYLAVYKAPESANFLTQALKNKKIKNKPIVVIFVDDINNLKQADSAFIPQKFNSELNDIANALRGSNTLLISNNSTNKRDVMINLIEQDGSSVISFEVNKPNIIHEKLSMSADLLLLGGSELDVAALYREMEVEVQQSKKQSIQLSNELAKQEIKLTKQKSKLTALSSQLAHTRGSLDKLNKELVENTKIAQAQKNELAQLQQSLINNHLQLTKERLELQQVTKQYQRTGNKLRTQESILEDKTKKNEEIMSVVEQNKMVLEQQRSELTQQKNELTQQSDRLKAQATDLFSKKKTIHDQQTYLILTSSLAIVAFLAILLIVFFFNKSQKTTKKLALTLTNLNDTQAQLIQSEKFASLGRLTAGVAHEINTPLSVAITANSLVSEDTLDVKNKIESASLSKARMVEHIVKAEESSAMIDSSLNRVKNLLDNFKLVAADQENEDQREINLTDYINEVISTLNVEMKKNNTSYQCAGDTNILITTLPGVFYQVLTNLIMNSITHGFDNTHKGEISITTSLLDKDRVEVYYRDNGQGMDEYTLKNIFEPFFTTARGQGSTGLGMNIVYNLVHQQLKGDISVEAEQNVGTFIKIILPITL